MDSHSTQEVATKSPRALVIGDKRAEADRGITYRLGWRG
jgi:hypothetical protein